MKVRLSLYLSSLTGKADDINARRHKGRLLIYKNPDQKHTLDERKKLIQKNTALVTKHWREMLPAKRKLWATASVGKLGNSRNGEKYRLGGYQYYLQVNLKRVHAGKPIAENPYYLDVDEPVFEIGHTWWTIDKNPDFDKRFGGHWEMMDEIPLCSTNNFDDVGKVAEGQEHKHIIKSRIMSADKQMTIGDLNYAEMVTIDEWDNEQKFQIGGSTGKTILSRSKRESTSKTISEWESEGSTSWEKLTPENFQRLYLACWVRVE